MDDVKTSITGLSVQRTTERTIRLKQTIINLLQLQDTTSDGAPCVEPSFFKLLQKQKAHYVLASVIWPDFSLKAACGKNDIIVSF